MRIDYCPECHEAGLRYETKGIDCEGRNTTQRYELYLTGGKSNYGRKKWCNRCQKWVIPQSFGLPGVRYIKRLQKNIIQEGKL